jgi:dihydroorotate dehydrogenase
MSSFTLAAHDLAIELAKWNLSPTHHPSALEQRVSVDSTVFGRHFSNPIGLGAGFDKNGEVIEAMLDLGFGSVEIGTVTPRPQPGNPKPRMFRLTEDLGIINRYGFNSKGADRVEENLREFRQQPVINTPSKLKKTLSLFRGESSKASKSGIVGVNIGKNKDSQDGDILEDYRTNIHKLGPYADYLVLNISSPNTAGLRDLQQGDALRALLTGCIESRDKLAAETTKDAVPLLVKIAPDLDDDQLKEVAGICLELHIDGLIVTNTTNQRPADLVSFHRNETGGLSGAPVKDRSTECIRKVYAATGGKIPIIGVGGVGSGKDAYDKLKAGASIVQVYSMMVYQGPGLVSRIRHELAEIMIQNGQRRVQDVIGLDHNDLFWKSREERSTTLRKNEEEIIATGVV